jgi:ubiquinone biosynthesis protein COQ4
LLRTLRAIRHFVLVIAVPADRFQHGTQYIKLTEGGTFDRSLAEFGATAAGAALLRERPDPQPLLNDQAALETLPKGSLGRLYSEFLSSAQLEGDAYFSAVRASCADDADPVRAWYRERIGVMHDLRHLITGYGPDRLGEACLLAFRLAQTRQGGLIALVLLAMAGALGERPGALLPAVAEAYRRGRRARSLDHLCWEKGLDMPLAALRAELGLAPPERYAPAVAPHAWLDAEARSGSPSPAMALGPEASA